MIKHIVVFILCFVAAILGFYSPVVNNQLVSGIINLVGVTAFFCQYLYSHIDTFYIFLNKCLQKACNPKFNIIQTMDVKFFNDNLPEDFLENLLKKIQYDAQKKFDMYAKLSSKPSLDRGTVIFDENGIANINLYIYMTGDEDECHLSVEYKNSIQYNERIKELEFIRNIFELIKEGITVTDKRIQIRLFFKDKNPFYGYMLRKSKIIKVSNFALTFSINDNVQALVKRHYLEINSADYDEFNNVLKDIIILANINEF
ncbi:MAG: hypothetical protein LKJ22_00835 [Liquorilactobacillus nagelii]|jgi:hypothetical protein|uniref:hypothetical protein n=1 Tax=Liquorilactobacillus nagelii TaxID=82688 RepID=UPI00242C9F73|nr:hypothetical protein [Liquorilactobacillus nagelii]MCI1920448.1 hypothetical protein [Liquorilactobacillus nagelii]MCI1976092.1 hypothetical protein [Liquorilactobacillus nagelii]